jgi:hypothetical protein
MSVENLDDILAFVTEPDGSPPRQVLVNFGVFAGRAVTPAEIDELAKLLMPDFGHVSIVSEERHELSEHSEVSVQQVRIELPDDADAEQVVETAERWAQACIDDRHADLSDL